VLVARRSRWWQCWMWNENNSGFSTVFIRPLLGV
jgi:hypothetical protein